MTDVEAQLETIDEYIMALSVEARATLQWLADAYEADWS